MARFLTPLQAEKIDGTGPRARWRLVSPLQYSSDRLGTVVTVPAGFVTDFASVPRLPLAYLLAGDTAHEAATVHDYLYRHGGVSRTAADAVFLEAMKASGEPAWRRWLMWSAVRLYGGGAWARYRAQDA